MCERLHLPFDLLSDEGFDPEANLVWSGRRDFDLDALQDFGSALAIWLRRDMVDQALVPPSTVRFVPVM